MRAKNAGLDSEIFFNHDVNLKLTFTISAAIVPEHDSENKRDLRLRFSM